jgi:ankyrin repeat protein
VYCQVVNICGLVPARIRQALDELPETLDETYQRTLREINKADWQSAHRLFQFVAVASRPLLVEELAELLAFDFEAGPIPKFQEDCRLEDPVEAVLSTCSTLLAVVEVECYSQIRRENAFGKVIQFAHFSVREFLTSARLAETGDIIPRRYHISMTPAHTLVAQACLGILLHLDIDIVTNDNLERWPLAGYAAVHWADHARLEDVSRNVEGGMKQLFDPSKTHLAVCIWIYDPVPPGWAKRNTQIERLLPERRIPLHYAAHWGLLSMVESLVTENPQHVRSRGSDNVNATPLHLALQAGHVTVVRFLLEREPDLTYQGREWTRSTLLHLASEVGQVEIASILIERGADVTAQDNCWQTPLHSASSHGHVEVTCMLIERGADVTAQTKTGLTPLHLASERGQLEVAGVLIERGADVTAQTKNGSTPLHLASELGQVEVAKMLIERGADVTAKNGDRSTPLHLASSRGQVKIAGMLIERGADVTAQDKSGSTPLHLASTSSFLAWRSPQRYTEVTRILLKHGADVTVRWQDKDGQTPLDLASSDRVFEEAVHVLLQHGAVRGTHNNKNAHTLPSASQFEHYQVYGFPHPSVQQSWQQYMQPPSSPEASLVPPITRRLHRGVYQWLRL